MSKSTGSVAGTVRRASDGLPIQGVYIKTNPGAGTVLTDAKKKVQAKVTADGNLITNTYRGSIHKVGAAVQGAPSCNGWTYWHYRAGDESLPIDHLREKIRSESKGTETLQ